MIDAPRPRGPTRGCRAHLVLGALAALALPALAQAPAEPVSLPERLDLVVPFPPGGGAEFVARELETAVPASGGPRVRLVHRPGDLGLAGAEFVAGAAPDGATLLLGSRSSLVFGPLAHGRTPLRPVADFEPVAIFATIPRLILVHPSLPVTTIDALVRLARNEPSAVPCGTSDALSLHAARTFSKVTGVVLACTAYESVSPRLRDDLLAGTIKLAFESALLPEVKAGRLRALAVAGPGPVRALPGVPTASEAGLPGYDMSVWVGIFAPPRTPPATVAALAAAFGKAVERAETQAALTARGYTVRLVTGHALAEYLAADARDAARLPALPPPRTVPPS